MPSIDFISRSAKWRCESLAASAVARQRCASHKARGNVRGTRMSRLSISKAWDETSEILVRDGRLYASVALALVVLPATVIGLFAPRSETITPMAWVFLAISIVIGFAAQIALNRLAIGPSTTVKDAIIRGFARMPVVVGSFLMLCVALMVVLIILVLILGAAGLIASPESGAEPPWFVIALIVLLTALCYAIFQLTAPVAAVESGGSVSIMKRSWDLARGEYLRLLAFVLIALFGLIVVVLAGQFVIGSMVAAALGPPMPGSLSALLISLVVALIQSVFTVIFGVMLARIYVQLAASGPVSVPSSGA